MNSQYPVPRVWIPANPPTDWAELSKIVQGDRASQVSAYERYRPLVFGQFQRALPFAADPALETDVLLSKVLGPDFLTEKAHPSKGKFHNLLGSTASNHARNVWRSCRHIPVPVDPQTISLPAPEENPMPEPPLEAFLIEQAREKFHKECKVRNSPMADVIDLLYIERISYAETARRLGLTVYQVTMGAHRGKKRLHRLFFELLARWRIAHPERADEADSLRRRLEARRARGRPGETTGLGIAS